MSRIKSIHKLSQWQRLIRLPHSHGDLISCVAIAIVVLAAYAPAWATGRVFYQLDTIKQNAPFLEYAAASMRSGSLPLWNPYLATGFPQFAEGQTGALHPLNAPFLAIGAIDALLIWGPVLRALLAALAVFALARTLNVSTAGAAVSGLAFGLGSFVVAQQHHINHANSAFALPACLAAFEMAMRASTSRRRIGWFLGAALVFATALLAVHPQVTMVIAIGMILFAAGSLALGRWNHPTGGWRNRATVLAWSLIGGLVVAIVAGGLSAVQTIPLIELIGLSGRRSETLDTAQALQFAIPPLGAVQLLFPAVFGGTHSYWFSWNAWEMAFYVGLVPLTLAMLAVRRPSRSAVLFAAVALLAVLFAQGSQSPVPLWDIVSGWPGFDRARAPGRYSLLAVLALAMLAGIGLDVLRRHPPLRLTLALAGLVVASLLALGVVHAWIVASPDALHTWLATQPDLSRVDERSRHELVAASTTLTRPANLVPALAALTFVTCIALAAQRRRGSDWLAPAAFILIALELALFAATFHPVASPHTLLAPPAYGGDARTYPRTFVSQAIESGSNRLLPARHSEATGYTPLIPWRVAALHEVWNQSPARAARVLGVDRVVYLSDPVRGFESHTVEASSATYSLTRPVAVIHAGATPNERSFALPATARSRTLHLVLSMDGGLDAVQASPIATLTWIGSGQAAAVAPVRAGIEVVERTGFGPLRHGQPAHHSSDVNVAASVGERHTSLYTYADFDFPVGTVVDTVVVNVVRLGVALTVHGMSITDDAGHIYRFWSPPLTRVAQPNNGLAIGRESLLVGSFPAPPRAELAHRVRLVDASEDLLALVRSGHLTLEDRPVIEAGPWGPSIAQELLAADDSPAAGGQVRVYRERDARLEFEVSVPSPAMLIVRDAFYPGWKAAVDGKPAPVFPANLVQRAVPLPAGAQHVELWYDPPSFRLGAAISAVTAIGTLATALALWQGPRVRRATVWANRRRR